MADRDVKARLYISSCALGHWLVLEAPSLQLLLWGGLSAFVTGLHECCFPGTVVAFTGAGQGGKLCLLLAQKPSESKAHPSCWRWGGNSPLWMARERLALSLLLLLPCWPLIASDVSQMFPLASAPFPSRNTACFCAWEDVALSTVPSSTMATSPTCVHRALAS